MKGRRELSVLRLQFPMYLKLLQSNFLIKVLKLVYFQSRKGFVRGIQSTDYIKKKTEQSN